MDNNIQTILIYIIAITLLFIFPVYIAYEKKDDISYALVLSYTQDFVDSTKSKGFISKNEFADFLSKIASTGNLYDIEIEHKHQSINPIIKEVNCMRRNSEGILVLSSSYNKADYDSLTEIEKDALYSGYDKVDFSYDYKINTQIYGTKYINNILNQEVDYYMNVDDFFSIKVKNRNTTLATVMYNLVTVGNVNLNTRIYVNYGGQVLDTKWYSTLDNVQYAITDSSITDHIIHTNGTEGEISKLGFGSGTASTGMINSRLENNFTIEITAILFDENSKAFSIVPDNDDLIDDINNINILLGKSYYTSGDIMIGLGYYGIAVLRYEGSSNFKCIASYAINEISSNQLIKIVVKNNLVSVLFDDKRVAYGSYSGNLVLTNSHNINNNFQGIVNIKVFKTSE